MTAINPQRVVHETDDLIVMADDTSTLRLIVKRCELTLSLADFDELVNNVHAHGTPRSPRCTSPAKARIQRFKISSPDAQ